MAIREVAGADVSSTTPIAQIGAHFTGWPRRAGDIGAVDRRSILPPAPFCPPRNRKHATGVPVRWLARGMEGRMVLVER